MKLKLVGLVSALLFMTSAANAGFLIDPYFGMGSTKSGLDLPGEEEETSSSTVMGARLGYTFTLLSAGIDYQMMSAEDSQEEDVKITTTSAFVGVDLPILLRFWAEYMFSSNQDGDSFDDTDSTFNDGYGLGIGFTGLPFVSINLEIEALNYTLDVGQDTDYSVASTILSVSFPINL